MLFKSLSKFEVFRFNLNINTKNFEEEYIVRNEVHGFRSDKWLVWRYLIDLVHGCMAIETKLNYLDQQLDAKKNHSFQVFTKRKANRGQGSYLSKRII